MARIFITGSSDGIGKAAAQTLLSEGHQVVVHARSQSRLMAVRELLDRGAQAVVGDLADLRQTKDLAEQVNRLGRMDAIIHNAGVYLNPEVMRVNVVAPYVLTALIARPDRLVYLSSRMHRGGQASHLEKVDFTATSDSSPGAYSDSKLFVTAFAFALARLWPDVVTSVVDPGWIPTKMGGAGAPDDLRLGHTTQEWLVTTQDARALVSGGFWHHLKRVDAHPDSQDEDFQNELLKRLESVTGVTLPKS